MYLLQIVSVILLIIAFIWAVVLLRRQRDKGVLFITITVGFILLYESLELLRISGWNISVGDRVWMGGAPISLLAFFTIYFLYHSLTEHSRLEEQLRLGDLIYKTLFNAANDIITIVDRQTMTLLISIVLDGKYGYRCRVTATELVT